MSCFQRHPKAMLCTAVLFWGTLYTIARKAQFVTRTVGTNGQLQPHHHAMFHTLFMFFGIASFLPIDAYNRRVLPKSQMPHLPKFSPTIFIIPAMCDVCCTAVDSLGLMKTHVSVYQMLRSCLIIFTSLLSRCVLGNKLSTGQIVGVLCIVVGCIFLGLSNTHSHFAIAEEFAPKPLFGNCMVILGQFLIAVMFVYEEKVMNEYDIPVMQVVGWEGVWGILAASALLVIFYLMPGEDCGLALVGGGQRCSFDNGVEAFYEATHNKIIFTYLLIASGSMAIFNYFGTKVTQLYSSTFRAMIDCTRMLCVWALTFVFQWEQGRKPQSHWLQLFGYAIILVGFVLFSKVIGAKDNADEDESAGERQHLIQGGQKEDQSASGAKGLGDASNSGAVDGGNDSDAGSPATYGTPSPQSKRASMGVAH